MTTAIYLNRIEDKIKVEKELGLTEEGKPNKIFYFNKVKIAVGYERIVYGDHGPYIEFRDSHFYVNLIDRFGRDSFNLKIPKIEDAKFYYYWLNPIENDEVLDLKVYLQIKPVTNLPNAPKREDGKKSNFNRIEGYADYKRGYYYIDPWAFDR